MFTPTTKEELNQRHLDSVDIIFVSGDTYIDVSNDGVALLAKYLNSKGFTTAIIAQPDIDSDIDISRLGQPNLFWGVSGGCVDSMVANYTSSNKKRRNDDLTPGGINDKRPDRAVIAYTNLIKKYFKNNKPVIIGGIEASLRRIAHYDYWSDKIRRSVLLDSKADLLFYGMAEKSLLEYAECIRAGKEFKHIKGICYMDAEKPLDYLELESFEEVTQSKAKFAAMFDSFYKNNDPLNAKGLVQKYDKRYLIQNPPQLHLTTNEIDEIYSLEFERDAHPYYKAKGVIKALDTVKFSVNSHRGCFGECNFCAIAVHQGRKIVSRSEQSIIDEVKSITKHKDFKGYIYDIGGATANMYKMNCPIQDKQGSCKNKRCIFPVACKNMDINHKTQIDLLSKLRTIKGIKKIFIGSGIRYDLIIADTKSGDKYMFDLVKHHVSGQMKIAPEHIDDEVLKLMGKPSNKNLLEFRDKFNDINKNIGLKQFLTYYFIAAHPGCGNRQTENLKNFLAKELKFNPEQIQIFTPTPSTYSTLMYYTGKSIFDGTEIQTEKSLKNKLAAKELLQSNKNYQKRDNEDKKKNWNNRRKF